jgi:hypothetical protein
MRHFVIAAFVGALLSNWRKAIDGDDFGLRFTRTSER